MSQPEQGRQWDLDAGLLPLDFANTAEWHAAPEPTERLNSYKDLVEWSKAARLLTDQEAQQLLDEAARRPKAASRTLTRAIEIREMIYQIFSGWAADQQAPEEALAALNDFLSVALQHVTVNISDDGFAWGWSSLETNLDHMLWPIVRSAANLLTSEDLERVGECADDRGCGYLFFDRSRNRSRRWCSMESCGNRAKALRHYRQSKS